MRLSEAAARAMAAKAASIEERLDLAVEPVCSTSNEALRKHYLNTWQTMLAKGNSALFNRRLQWDRIDADRLRNILGDVKLPSHVPLPSWVATVQAALDAAGTVESCNLKDLRDSPLPFEEILASFVCVARHRLQALAQDACSLLAPEAHRALEGALLKSLVYYSAQSLQLEFSIMRVESLSPFGRLLIQSDQNYGCELYLKFVERMLQGGLAKFFEEYAVLARQLATIADLWVESHAEWLRRLQYDRPELEKVFGTEGSFGKIAKLESGLSDPHRGRRSVLALVFEDGTKIIYKPKDLDVEREFQEMLAWLNGIGQSIDSRVLRILPKDGYGWVEYVEHRPCSTREEARRYFMRAGTLLCLMYLLEGVDCHYDNLIAESEYPVLVDCEALMQPRLRLDDVTDTVLVRSMAQDQLSRSVLHSGMLPEWQILDDGKQRRIYDVSALGGVRSPETIVQYVGWTDVNSDRMEVNLRPVHVPIKSKGAVLNGENLHLEDWYEETIAGFRATYHALLSHREELMMTGRLHAMGRGPVRFIHRDTRVYASLRLQLWAPEHQRDGVSRSIQLDLLCRVLIPQIGSPDGHNEEPAWWPIASAERLMMQSEDIPYFEAIPSENLLILPDGKRLHGLFEGPSLEIVYDRLRRMDEADLERQASFIVGSVYSQIARPGITSQKPPESRSSWNSSDPLPDAKDFVAEASAIAEDLQKRAIRSDRSATWIGPQLMYRAECYQLQPLNNDLYTGVGGVMLFLAAAGRYTHNADFINLARAAANPLRDDLEQEGPKLLRAMGIGGATGLGSVIYVLTKMAAFLDDKSMLGDAAMAAALLTEEAVAGDIAYDVFDGAAGAILGLLALYNATGEPKVLECAEVCGRHLIQNAKPAPDGHCAWITIEGKMMGGFSHGVAGIACALMKLFRASGKKEYRELALDAIAYENSLFSSEAGNWTDLRAVPPQKIFTASWCHGAPGIALGRLQGLYLQDIALVRHDIEAAIELMKSLPIYDVDYPCCGSIGVDEVLLVAAQKLGRPDLAAIAARRSWLVVARARQAGRYALDPAISHQVYNPSFFQGCAGIGYTLLRHAYPSELPSVLAFE